MTGDRKFDRVVSRCFAMLGDKERIKFEKKFRKQPHNHIQSFHILHELVLGAFLAQHSFKVQSELKLGNQTPDWVILDKFDNVQCIVELVNFHVDANTRQHILSRLQEGLAAAYFPKSKINTKRLYSSLEDKFSKYKSVANKYNSSYVVSLFSDSFASVNGEELRECLYDDETGLFLSYPEVSGVLFFEEASSYHFTYEANPNTRRRFFIREGIFQIITNEYV